MGSTIKDVAKEAGVSISTVSKYINGGNVREKNRIPIKKAIDKLGFSPNIMARGLRSSRSYTIGLVISYLNDAYMAINAAKIEKILWKSGYSVIFCCHRDTVEMANMSLKFLADKRVDGVLFNAMPGPEYDLNLLLDLDIPIVSFEQFVHPELLDCITVDNSYGAYKAVEYLYKQGHKRIATITGGQENNTAIERLRGYKRFYEDYQLEYDPRLIYEGAYDVNSGYQGIMHLLALDSGPDALFAANYHMCIGAVMGLQQKALQLPEELSIITYDDMIYSRIVSPTLTSVRQPIDEMAELACETLLKRIDGDYSGHPLRVRIKPELVLRDSVINRSKK